MSSVNPAVPHVADDPYTAVPDAQAQHAAAAAAATAQATSADAAATAATLKMAPEGDKVALALARMQASRARLRHALVPKPADAGSGQRQSSGFGVMNIAKLLWRQVRGGFAKSPSLDMVAHTVQTWWQRQPWHGAASMAGGEVQKMVVPMVRRHPWQAVALAAAVGAAVVVARPWRWSLVTGQARKLRSEAFRLVRNQVFNVPLQMLLASLTSLLMVQATAGSGDGAPATGGTGPMPDDDGLSAVQGVGAGSAAS